VTEPFRDNEHSIRERAAKLAHEIHDLDQQIAEVRRVVESRRTPAPWRTALDGWMVLALVSGIVLGVVIGDRQVPERKVQLQVSHTCGFH
jgi:F0F1-type ATP synthase assembly protein I